MGKWQALILCLGVLLADCARADEYFRCGNALVEKGDTTYEVLRACGGPDYREYLPHTAEEAWFYDCGANRFIKILTFRNSRLRRIDTGGYGSEHGLPCPQGNPWLERQEMLR